MRTAKIEPDLRLRLRQTANVNSYHVTKFLLGHCQLVLIRDGTLFFGWGKLENFEINCLQRL